MSSGLARYQTHLDPLLVFWPHFPHAPHVKVPHVCHAVPAGVSITETQKVRELEHGTEFALCSLERVGAGHHQDRTQLT